MSTETYGVSIERAARSIPAPQLPYGPRIPRHRETKIAVIGCGGISQSHLQAYYKAGYNVVELCDHTLAKAEARRSEFFPNARVATDFREVLAQDGIGVVDITTHPNGRPALIEAALHAGKHVLSQKPFVVDLAEGERLVSLAASLGRKLAVNQNGRWAPHFSWMREAIYAGLIGDVASVDFSLHWDHHWIVGTAFEELPDLLLYDFAIHWFDIATLFFGQRRARKVYASAAHSPGQRAKPPFLAHACVEFDSGQATFAFNADCPYGQEDRTTVAGTRGLLRGVGPSLTSQRVSLHTAEGIASPDLEGSWFPDGFHGSMAELLCAIEENREPLNSARENLRSLALCIGAVQSAHTGQAVVPRPAFADMPISELLTSRD